MAANARHSKESKRWGTPEEYVEAGRRVMGGIDLDPCSEARFEATVRATRSYSLLDRGEDGLVLPWAGRIFLNPPGGAVRAFWRRLMSENGVRCAIWIGFSVEQLCVLADEELHPADFCLCLVRTRIDFERHDGHRGNPTHANYVCGVGVDRDAFEREFALRGRTLYGRCAE